MQSKVWATTILKRLYIICNSVGKEDIIFWDDILTLADEGHNIGSHSMNHKKLSKLSDEEMKEKLSSLKNV